MTALDFGMLAGLFLLFYYQYKRTGVFFLPGTVWLLTGIILAVYVAYPLATSDRSLVTIGQAGHFRTIQWGVDKALVVVTVGVITAILTYILAGLFKSRFAPASPKPVPGRLSMNDFVMGACLTALLAQAYIFYTFYRAGVLPLFSANPLYWRFDLAKNWGGSLYLGALAVSSTAAIFLMAAFALRKIRAYKLLSVAVIMVTCFLNLSTATRSTFLLPFVSAGLIYYTAKEKKLTLPRTLGICAGILVLAASLQAMRYQSSMSWSRTEDEILYGDTFFANFRDTGWTLAYFDLGRYNFVHGKTILAGLLGFLPHDEFSFRSQYRWGTFAARVVGQDDPSTHAGLAHVYFADWYVNFGYRGVAVAGLLFGLILRVADERLLRVRNRAKSLAQFDCYAAFKVWCWCGVATALISSAEAPFAYPQIAALLAIAGLAAAFHKISLGLRAVVHLPPSAATGATLRHAVPVRGVSAPGLPPAGSPGVKPLP
jgi:oligosaccharide repeat unit polymerase